VPAFAAEGAPADTSISVSGLDAGDTVNFYQVLKYDETANTTGGWVATEKFAYDATTNPNGLQQDDILKILGMGDYATGKSKAGQAGIDAALAGRISLLAQADGVTAKFANVSATGDGTSKIATQATTAVGDAGLYLALVTPGTVDYLYNPVFVGADYTEGGTNSQAAVMTASYSDEALAKKEQITLTKEVTGDNNGTGTVSDTTGANTKYDVDVGDDVEFTIASKVPAYSSAYQNPTYEITDTMQSGLRLKKIKSITIDNVTLAVGDYSITPNTVALNTEVAYGDSDPEINSFKIALTAAGLAKVAATKVAQNITIVYEATVTSLAEATVTEKTNEANVKFSNNPDDNTSYSLLEDKTRNYTFSIDANLLGYTGTSYETDELIKVGLKADGTPWTTTTKYRSGTTWTDLAPLPGATFGLYTDSECKNLYTNTTFNGTVVSDATGRLKITGLDCGTYYLKETSAPTGYIADNRTFEITIAATYTHIEGGEYTNTDNIKVKYDGYDVLKGYTVTVNDGSGTPTTSTYNISNKGPEDHKVVDKATYQTLTGEDMAGDAVTPISNTQGTALPSTGGMGTTILYVGGSILVILAAILLITKRRMNAED